MFVIEYDVYVCEIQGDITLCVYSCIYSKLLWVCVYVSKHNLSSGPRSLWWHDRSDWPILRYIWSRSVSPAMPGTVAAPAGSLQWKRPLVLAGIQGEVRLRLMGRSQGGPRPRCSHCSLESQDREGCLVDRLDLSWMLAGGTHEQRSESPSALGWLLCGQSCTLTCLLER